jgi:hypothetical protein
VRSEGLKRIERRSIPFQREADSFGRLLLLREQHTPILRNPALRSAVVSRVLTPGTSRRGIGNVLARHSRGANLATLGSLLRKGFS